MTRPEERSLKGQEGWGSWGDVPLPANQRVCGAAVSSPSGVWGNGDLAIQNVVQAYKSAPGVNFADIKFISVKLSWASQSYKAPANKFLWGTDPCGIGAYGATESPATCDAVKICYD